MWNLEQTERRVVRLIPIVVIITLLALLWLSFRVDPQRLSTAFAPTASPTVWLSNE